MMLRNAVFALLLPALAAAAPAPPAADGSVASLRLEAREGRTELTVEIAGGQVQWTDFALGEPPRVVVDIHDATLDLPARRFEGLDRGGVRGVRTSQHEPTIVRVVLDLERETAYRVVRVPEGLRITFRIAEGRRLAVSGVRIEGNERVGDNAVVDAMKTRPEGFLWWRKGAFNETELAGDVSERTGTTSPSPSGSRMTTAFREPIPSATAASGWRSTAR